MKGTVIMRPPLTRDLLSDAIRASQMTRWFNLKMLAGTLRDIAVSSLIGDRFDSRSVMASTPQPDYFDYDTPQHRAAPFWFDYTADVGDGWNPTYAIARLLCDENLAVAESPETQALPRAPGQLLVLGGDAVYPSASREAYSLRFALPYRAASYREADPQGDEPDRRDLYALPGNHDWYDGLGSFLRLFASGRIIGRFRTRQQRSYFALKLPHRFWLLAIDSALSGEIDSGQVQYFYNLMRRHVQDGDTLILCYARPDWAFCGTAEDRAESLFDFEAELLAVATSCGRSRISIALRLSGDLHYYKHFASVERGRRVHSLIAGGGGAFLHPTHNIPEVPTEEGSAEAKGEPHFRQVASFPSAEESRQQTRGSLFFLKSNPSLWGVLLLIYLLSTLAYSFVGSEVLRSAVERTYGSRLAGDGAAGLLQLIVLAAHSLVLLGCCYAIVDVSKRRQRGGTFWEERGRFHIAGKHALVHILPYVLLQIGNSLFDYFCYSGEAPYEAGHTVRSNLIALSIAVFCSPFSAVVFWAYLRLALDRYGRHENDAFAAMRIEDYKSFLRICVEEGRLVVHAIGLRVVPKRWEVVEHFREGAPCVVPAAGEPLRPHVIERIVIERS
jgi:hypothetical protein